MALIVGYFVANCLSFASTDLYLLIKLKIWKVISWKPENRSLKKEMVAYSVPMGLGNIGWWINNVSDRYIVTWICGLAANGVYSVAYKIPSLLSMFQQIFNQAWTISAVKEYDQDSSEFYSTMVGCMSIDVLAQWMLKPFRKAALKMLGDIINISQKIFICY